VQPAGTEPAHLTSRIEPAKRTSGFGIPAGGLQKAEEVFAGQTTIRAMLTVLGPTRTVEEVGCGLEQDGNASGWACWLSAVPVSHGLNACTKASSSGEAPTGRV